MIKQKRITAFLLSAAMTLSLLPTFTPTASAEETQTTTTTGKNITLGTSALKGGQASNVYFGNYQQSSLGNTQPEGTEGIDWIQSTTVVHNELGAYYSKDPIKWRVLDNDYDYDKNAVDGETDTTRSLFLLSDKNLDVVCYHEDYEAVTWVASTIRSWLNGYKASSNTGEENGIDYTNDNFIGSAFSENEKKEILSTTVEENIQDKVFLLSVAEAQNTSYFADNNSRIAVNTAYVYGGGKTGTTAMSDVGNADYWWLRSPAYNTKNATNVTNYGGVNDNGFAVYNNYVAVRPVFNLNPASVLFTSAAADGKKTENVGTLSANAENSGNEYKLTILDESRKFTVTETTAKCTTGETLQFNYDNANIGDNEYISAMIVNNAGEVVYYGQLAKAESGKAAASLVLPSDFPYGAYTLNLFNEQINGDYKTDYASAFSDIELIVELDGNGTEQDPYLINNVDEFEDFRDSVSNGNRYTGKYINLTADIDLTGRTWSPIGVNYSDFEGIFDGQNHTISNMKFTTAKNGYGGDDHLTYHYQGLFGIIRNGAIVRNFTVTGEITLAVDEQKYIGGAVGFAYEDALVSNVTSYVNITDGGKAYRGINDIGGVVGRIGNNNKKDTNAYVDWCGYYGEINVDTASNVGGIVGHAIKNSSVTNSTNYGTVGWNYIGHIGGVVGSTEQEVLVKNCANYGSVTACRNDCVGGVVGYIQNGTITNCLNGGSVSGRKSNQSNEPDVYLGGILGYQNNSSLKGVTNCFNYGKITDLDGKYTYTGAIVGYSRNAMGGANIKDNYYLNSSLAGSAQKASGSGTIGTNNTSVNAIKAASGEIAYKMQEYITDGEQVWGQKLSGENYEAYPKIGGEKVYYGTKCNGIETYANETVGTSHSHYQGVCEYCGEAKEKLKQNTDGYYEIGSKEQYIKFMNMVNVNGGKDTLNAVLTADIDLSGYECIPIGREGNEFIGTFDGNGHKIENLTIIANNSYMGMFGRTKGATIKNFTVSGNITAVCNTLEVIGGVIGHASDTDVSNVISKINFNDNGKIEHIYRAGGIMAAATKGTTITNCEYSGNVKLHFGSTMGGMVGDVYESTKENPVVIKNCVNKANMTFDISRRVAGIAGWCDTYTTVSQCANYGNITIKQSDGTNQAAGIVATTIHALTVEDCANYGDITDGKFNSSVGGIVGYIEVKESAAADFGGVKNCFNYGTITNTNEKGSTYWGSVIGIMKNNDINLPLADKITNNYYLENTAPTVSGTEGIALTATAVSAEQLSSGEISHKLQGTQSEQIWGQTIGTDNYPNLNGEKVYKVKFVTSDNADYAARYANSGKTVTLPENPTSGTYTFSKWLSGNTADSAEFTAQTPISEDITVYAFGSETPVNNTEKSDVVTAYPDETITVNLSDYIKTASGNDGNFSFALKEGSTLPQGLALLNGTVSGVPQQLGETEVTFTVTNDGEISLMSLNEEKTELTIKFNVRLKGEGTEQAPYEINSLAALEIFRDSVNGGNNYSGKIVKLTGDIDMSDKYGKDKASWSPIGNAEQTSFWGKFNGDGHKITGMYINSSDDYQGLFGYTEYATIENLNVSGLITVSGQYYVGGIVGWAVDTTINNCSFDGSISGKGNDVGGIAGCLDGTIKNCVNCGDITAVGYIGGIVGNNGIDITIENCYNSGKITAANSNVGGIVGYATNPIIKNCYNTGDITGKTCVGGIVGCHYIDIFGSSGTSVLDNAIENCYNSGKITSSDSYKGGIIGDYAGSYIDHFGEKADYEIKINDCYYLDSSVSGGNYTAENFGKTLTAEQMKHSENFVNWDFETVWKEGAFTPLLRENSEVSTKNAPDLKITSADDLKAFRDSVNGGNTYEGKYILLAADIDLKGSESDQWTPIGTDTNKFQGAFDGDGHEISGLYIKSTSDNQGLFGYIGEKGVVKNLSVDGTVMANYDVGGVVAYNDGTVENCSFSGSVSGSGSGIVGGVVGYNNNTVENCYNTGSVTGNNYNVGGVVGVNDGTVKNSYNTGSVTGDRRVGGVVGLNDKGTVKYCYNTGNVSATSNFVGGVVGKNSGSKNAIATVENCYNTGSVGGKNNVGSVVGYNDEEYAEVTNCYYLKDTTFNTKEEEESPGGFDFGNLFSTTDSGTSGEAETLGTALTAEQMKNSASFTDWDFTNTWIMGNLSPMLKAIPEDATENNPITISTVSEFKAFRDSVNNGNTYEGKYIMLKADLDLEGSESNQWTAIGTGFNHFKGTFDGDGHKISGLYINSTSANQGLFGCIGEGSTVKNLSVDGTVMAKSNVGGVVERNDGTVENCSFSGSVTGNEYNVGGVVAYNNGTVENCYNTGSVTGNEYNVGGVVGVNGGTVKNSYNTGSATGESRVGGVVAYNDGTVENSYNTGSVTGNNYDVGGVVGKNNSGTVKNSYNTGSVGGKNNVGSVVGYNDEEYAEVTNCYYLDTCAADGTTFTSTVGTSFTAEQMKKNASFENWDFTNTWVMKSDRPILKNNPEQMFEIKSVGADGEKATATVIILKEGAYTFVFADYENGGLNNVDIVTVTVTAEQLGENTITSTKAITLGTDDKIMLWDNLENLTPLCEAYEVK